MLAEVELAALAAGLRGRVAAHTVSVCRGCGRRRLGSRRRCSGCRRLGSRRRCSGCRRLGSRRRCSGCRRLGDRLGLGGQCPACDYVVTVAELLEEER